MGLLDGFLGDGFEDPRSAAMMALSAGLLQRNLAGGLLGANQAFQDTKQNALKGSLTQAQIDNFKSEIAQRQLAAEKQAQLTALSTRLLSNSQRSDVGQGQLGSGSFGIMPTMGGAPDIPQNVRPRGIGGVDITDLAALQTLGGPDLLPYYKAANEGFERKPGSFYDIPGSGRQYIADPTKGVDFQNGRVSALPGYNDFVTQQTLAQEAPKTLLSSAANVNLRPNADGTQSPVSSLSENPTLQGVLQGVFGRGAAPQQVPMRPNVAPGNNNPLANLPPAQPGMTGKFEGDPAAVSAAIQNMTDPQERANAQSAFESQMRASGGNLPVAYGPTTAKQAQDAANKAFLEGRAKDANAYESSLNGRVQQGADMNMRLQEQLGALQKFRAGGGGETRAQLAQMAQAVPGMPKWAVDGIAGGDIASMQEFNKLAAQTAMEQLKQSMGGAGRISQYEFKVFQNNNPNLSTDPDAIRKIFDFNTRIFNRDLSEQQAFNSHIQSGGNPGDFAAKWQQQQAQAGFTNPNFRAQPNSPSLPAPMKGMVRNGYRFKGGDPSNPNSWEKQ